ncbi:membrane protein [Arthrobacter sp. Rue61a]|uniref:membrane protein n=1 Tax=Arthrobacter sp. Rue61a TaxID=1118963 RepID=UPI00027DF1B9|nr:membrane protein [Arthrobacter sp. Rue61a]AFR30481.1 putative integral membrane protein [Arthrobacter sp. Rue61a]
MVHVVPAFLSELRRPWLWLGSAVGALLVVGLIAVLLGMAGLESPTSPGIEVLRQASMSLMLTGAAVVGSFAFTSDYRAGCFTRRVLHFQRGPAFTARAASTALAALLVGVTIGVLFGLSGEILDGAWGFSFHAVLAFAGTACMGSLWGFAIGSLIRSHLVSLFVVPLSLVLPELLAGWLGDAEQFFFPVLAADWADQLAVHIAAFGSFVGAVSWLLVVTAVAFLVFLKRDLA